MNILSFIKDHLIINPKIKEYVGDRIRAFEYPETADTTRPFIIIEPVTVPSLVAGASNSYLAESHLIDIHVQGPVYDIVKELQEEIRITMWSIGFKQLSNGLDEYFKETKRFVDVRSYEGIPINTYYKKNLL